MKQLETAVDDAHKDAKTTPKIATEALDQAEEAKKKEDETSKILVESLAAFEEKKGKLAQQGYDLCYQELNDEYVTMANDSYTNGYEKPIDWLGGRHSKL